MKRIAVFAVLAFLAGAVFAQTSGGVSERSRNLPSSRDIPPPPAPASREKAEPGEEENTASPARSVPDPAPAAPPATQAAPPVTQAPAAVPAAKPAPAPAAQPVPAKTAPGTAAKPAPARTAPSQTATAQRTVPIVVQPIITNPPVVNNHYYGKVYNQAQAQTQAPAPTTIIIPIPVPGAPAAAAVQAAPQPAQAGPQAVPAPAAGPAPPRNSDTGYIIPVGPPRRTIRGTLGVERGMITLTDASEVKWFIMGLDRYIGLIEGLNIGEEAEIKGYAPAASSASRERFFQPLTLILDGAEYDIGPLSAATRAGSLQDTAVRMAAQPAQPAQTQPVQTPPGTVQTAGGFLYQPIIIQPAPPPPQEEKYIPWNHVHTSPWSPHYGPLGRDIDTSSFWNQKDDVWW